VIREALPEDCDQAVPLIYSSGSKAFDYVFNQSDAKQSIRFLKYCFVRKKGQFGSDNHWVYIKDGKIAATATLYSGKQLIPYTAISFLRMLKFYRLQDLFKAIINGLRTESIIRPPSSSVQYIAHVGTAKEFRGQGIASELIYFFEDLAKKRKVNKVALDVLVGNDKAYRLYKKLGYQNVELRRGNLNSEYGQVDDHIYMEKLL
jgi:ribosomal protein S18 acetylase RimI-like enzyme